MGKKILHKKENGRVFRIKIVGLRLFGNSLVYFFPAGVFPRYYIFFPRAS